MESTKQSKAKQSKEEKRLYAKIRHSQKLDKQGTRQGGYWRDVKGRQSEYQKEQERESLRKASKGLSKGAQHFAQEHGVATPGKLVSRIAQGQIMRDWSDIERGRALLFAGERPAYGRKAISGYRRAATEYIEALPLSYGGSLARVKAEKKAARRMAKLWALDPYDSVTVALILLHGPGHAERVSKAIKGMTDSLYAVAEDVRPPCHSMPLSDILFLSSAMTTRAKRQVIAALLLWCKALAA